MPVTVVQKYKTHDDFGKLSPRIQWYDDHWHRQARDTEACAPPWVCVNMQIWQLVIMSLTVGGMLHAPMSPPLDQNSGDATDNDRLGSFNSVSNIFHWGKFFWCTHCRACLLVKIISQLLSDYGWNDAEQNLSKRQLHQTADNVYYWIRSVIYNGLLT